jgi:hypothetical protein
MKVFVVIEDTYEGVSSSYARVIGVYYKEDKANTVAEELRVKWQKRKMEIGPTHIQVSYSVEESIVE